MELGNFVCINNLNSSQDLLSPLWKYKKRPIQINDNAWIATNAIILPGIKIGRGAVVGAGALVSKDVEDYSVVIGNPAKVIDKNRTKILNYNPCEFLAVNNAWLK